MLEKLQAQVGLAQCGQIRPTTTRESLMNLRAELIKRLADVDSAIDELDKIPDVESALNALNKVGLGRY